MNNLQREIQDLGLSADALLERCKSIKNQDQLCCSCPCRCILNEILTYYLNDKWSCSASRFLLKKDSIIYRSRIYTEPDATEKYKNKSLVFQGYDSNGSGIPPFDSSGRCNDIKTRCLYASATIETTIAEIKEEKKNEFYSVATIQVEEDLVLFNCGNDITAAQLPNSFNRWIQDFVLSLANLFSCPANSTEYSFYQSVVAFLINNGVDGVVYNSSKQRDTYVQRKKNYAIFKEDSFRIVSSKLMTEKDEIGK